MWDNNAVLGSNVGWGENVVVGEDVVGERLDLLRDPSVVWGNNVVWDDGTPVGVVGPVKDFG